jgi:hypothetical protein
MTGIFIRRKIEEVLTNYEPRANVSSIGVNEQPDRNGIDVDSKFLCVEFTKSGFCHNNTTKN